MKKAFSVIRDSVELNILYHPKIKDRMFCTKCGFPVRWLVPEEAMALSQTSLREIFRKIETDNLHFVETADGFLLVCCNSLTREITTSGETRNEIKTQLIAA